MGTIRFSLRADKADAAGKQPLELIYSVKGQRKYFRPKDPIKLWPEQWDHDNQKIVFLNRKSAKKLLPSVHFDLFPTEKETEDLNNDLQSLISSIKETEKRFELDKIPYSSKMVVEKLRATKAGMTKKEARSDEVYKFIDDYIEENKATREPGSLKVYNNLKNHLEAFQRIKKVPVHFSTIDEHFFKQFQNFLVTPRFDFIRSKKKNAIEGEGKRKEVSLNNTTAAKQLSTLKTFISYAKSKNIPVSDKYKDFKIRRPKLEVIALTNDEFNTLYHLDLTHSKRLAQTRDIFCFACTTGLRYSDLAQLRREHIKKDEIKFTVIKTGIELTVPLNPYSAAIIEKYIQHHFVLPIISNQKLNRYIHELCKNAGINDPVEIVRKRGNKTETNVYPKFDLVSIHTGRKTFCTLSLERGMSAEETMKISGHESYQSFQRYVHVTEQRKKIAMQKAWPEIEAPKAKVEQLKAV